jgi:uncharacterized protein (DUF2249 family)
MIHQTCTNGVLLEVNERVERIVRLVEAGNSYQLALADLISYLALEVLPSFHLEEDAVRINSGEAGPWVRRIEDEHRAIGEVVDSLSLAGSEIEIATGAKLLAGLMKRHVSGLAALGSGSAKAEADGGSTQAEGMDHFDTSRNDAELESRGGDVEALLADMVVEATRILQSGLRGVDAVQLLTRQWAVLRTMRPDLARIAALRLRELADDLRTQRVWVSGSPRNQHRVREQVLDVSYTSHEHRHDAIFAVFDSLKSGEGFELINDHDPKELWRELIARQEGEFDWEYLEAGPRLWRVRIARKAGAALEN